MTRSRALHLIDLENLLGTDRSAAGVDQVWTTYRRGVGIAVDDAVVVATGPDLARTAMFVLPRSGLRYHVRPGLDGADDALLDAVDLSHACARFGELVIASGDGAFAGLASTARARGLRVRHVTGRGLPSRRLSAACSYASRLRLDVTPALELAA